MSQPPNDGSDRPLGGSGPPDEGAEQPGPDQEQPGQGQPGQFGGYPGQYGQPSAAASGEQPGQYGSHPGQYGPSSPGPAEYGQPNYQYAQPATGSGPMSPGGPPPSGDKTSLVTVAVILAALLLIGAGVVIYLVSNGDDEDGASGLGPSPLVETTGASPPDATEVPTADIPTIDVPTIALPTDDFPTDFPTDDIPTDFPTDDFPTDLPSLPDLPTDGGPGDQAYVQVARGFVKAAAAGDCAGARAFGSDSFNEVYDDASVCAGATRAAMRDDDLSEFKTTVYGAYVASVEFDDGQTLIAMVVEDGKTPLVQSVLAYDF